MTETLKTVPTRLHQLQKVVLQFVCVNRVLSFFDFLLNSFISRQSPGRHRSTVTPVNFLVVVVYTRCCTTDKTKERDSECLLTETPGRICLRMFFPLRSFASSLIGSICNVSVKFYHSLQSRDLLTSVIYKNQTS